MLIFSPREMKYILYMYLRKKSKFSFYFIFNGKYREEQPNFFPDLFSFDFSFSLCSLGINKVWV